MPAPATTGGGLMSYPASVDSGGIAPVIISNEPANIGGNVTSTVTALAVLLYAFEIQASVSVTAARWHMGTTATGTANMAIYTAAGALVSGSDTGAVTNVASSDVTFTYTTPIPLAAGQYFMAFSSLNNTDTYLGHAAANSSPVYRGRKATNAQAAGAMPTTTGTIVATNLNVGCALILSGGLP